MSIRLITIDSEINSAKKLDFPCSTYLRGYVEDYDSDIIVRWGRSCLWPKKPSKPLEYKNGEFKKVLNHYQSIIDNCNKKLSLQRLSTIVKTPKIYEKLVPKRVKCVYRPNNHSGGKGFKIVSGGVKVQEGYYATQFIKTNLEYRVFFCGNKTMTVTRVKPKNKNISLVCRSLWGYNRFRKTPARLHKMALKAAKVLKLDMGAFDILVKNGNYYFLEANTAVTCDNKKIRDFYNKNILKLCKLKKFNNLKFS